MNTTDSCASLAAGPQPDAPNPEMLRALADGIPQLAWIADGTCSIYWYNKRWFDYTGTSIEEMRGWGWRAVHHPDHVERVVERITRSFGSGEPWEDTFPLRGKDGRYRWFLSRAEPIRDADGRVTSWFGTNTDVTEQLASEERARADSERLRLALASGAIVGTWFWDLRTDRFTIDEQFAHAFGIESTAVGEHLDLERVIATVHPEDRLGLQAAIADASARGGRYAHQYRVRRADGNYYWIEANGRVDHAPDGTPLSSSGVLLDVHGSRAAADALRETSRRLNAILDNTQMAVFLMDERQHCVYANAAAERLTGYASAQLQGRPLHDVVHHKRPDGSHYPIEECPIDRAFPARAQMQGEELFVAPDGGFYPVAFTASPIVDDTGRPVGTVIEARNIAEEKSRETALRENEARQRSILNAIPQMVWTTRPDGYHEFYNDRWYEFTGVQHGSTDGEGWAGMFHPDDQERAWSRWRHSLATGEPYEIEYRLRHRSGAYRWTLGRALPVRDGAGEIVHWIGTCTEIDELKRTGEELRRTSALLRLIGASTPDLIYAKDREGRVLYANIAVAKAVGRPLTEIVGHTDLDYVSDEAQARSIMDNDRLVIESAETLDVDETFTDPSGVTRHYRSLKAPLRDEHDRIVGVVGITSDVTRRREAEERERLLAREVDHRAKNMLAVVQSLVGLTKGADLAAYKKAVIGRVQALARAHDLLARSRWEGVDLKEVVRQELAAFADAEKLARVSGPALRLSPSAAQSFGLVVHELATNAAKYGAFSTSSGRLELRWALEGDASGGRSLRLVWRETGGPSVAAPASSGFGSALIRTCVERQLAGELTLDWHETGVVYDILVPATQFVVAEEPHAALAPENGRPTEPPSVFGGKRVLLVEDEAMIAMDIERMLHDAGCEVVGPAGSVDQAMRMIAGAPPAAALLDVNLGGREFSYRLADALVAKRVPFAFCTGYAGVSDLPPRFADTEVLSKPVTQEALIAALAKITDGAAEAGA